MVRIWCVRWGTAVTLFWQCWKPVDGLIQLSVYPQCKHHQQSKDRVVKKWTNSSTIPGHAAALAQAVLSKHGKCFDALRCEDCGDELSTVDAEKSLAVAEYVLKNKARKIEELEVEVHVHPRS